MTSSRDCVNVKPVIVQDAPNAHQVWLDIGVQHFTVGEYLETKEEAEWLANQLRTAIAALAASNGVAVYQYRKKGGPWKDCELSFLRNVEIYDDHETRALYTSPIESLSDDEWFDLYRTMSMSVPTDEHAFPHVANAARDWLQRNGGGL